MEILSHKFGFIANKNPQIWIRKLQNILFFAIIIKLNLKIQKKINNYLSFYSFSSASFFAI